MEEDAPDQTPGKSQRARMSPVSKGGVKDRKGYREQNEYLSD